jgi:hypothetical protein
LLNLSKEFPSLAALVEKARGGQSRLPLGGPAVATSLESPLPEEDGTQEPVTPEGPAGDGTDPTAGSGPETAEAGEEEEPKPDLPALTASVDRVPLPGRKRSDRAGRFGLRIRFEERPDEPELGRLVESTVWVNTAHPAYLRAVSSRSEGYHLALTVAMTLASLAVEPERTHAFVNSFLARWGEASKT